MKSKVLLFISLMIVFFSSFSQKYTTLTSVPPLKKGKLVLQDGTSYKFTKLFVKNDSVEFLSANEKKMKFASNDVYKISKYGNYAGTMALSFGLVTVICSPILFLAPSENQGTAFAFYFATMGGVTGIATLLGWALKKEVVMYRTNQKISFYPSFNVDQGNRVYPSLTIKIPISNRLR